MRPVAEDEEEPGPLVELLEPERSRGERLLFRDDDLKKQEKKQCQNFMTLKRKIVDPVK